MRTLKIGVIMDPIEKINIEKDTTFVLMVEAQKRGHELYYMEPWMDTAGAGFFISIKKTETRMHSWRWPRLTERTQLWHSATCRRSARAISASLC